MEIQRLIGRALRAVVDRAALGERTITLDCDVLQADGGTRTVAISGAYVALVEACRKLLARGVISPRPDPRPGRPRSRSGSTAASRSSTSSTLEDAECDTDMNVVMNDGGGIVELQGTAEGHAFRRGELDRMLDLAAAGIAEILARQREALARP
ncbi:MAG: ribonuclease PH [Xanthomonadales bacterium]|nr:ribonuclease PH [Xanthomonadales bacterium]